jgi:hypothetical protein
VQLLYQCPFQSKEVCQIDSNLFVQQTIHAAEITIQSKKAAVKYG